MPINLTDPSGELVRADPSGEPVRADPSGEPGRADPSGEPGRADISAGWFARSFAGLESDGRAISSPGFSPDGWYPVDLPCTFLDVLVRNGVLPEPYFGLNLKKTPGFVPVIQDVTRYQQEIHNFADIPYPPESPFRFPWWYYRSFALPESGKGRRAFLRIAGVNYSAGIWLNGKRMAERECVVGPYRSYEFEIGDFLVSGRNSLAIEVTPPETDDLALTFVDWNPMAPDKCAGLLLPVYVAFASDVTARNTFIRTELDTEELAEARLTVGSELENRSDQSVTGVFELRFEDRRIAKEVTLAPREKRIVALGPGEYDDLVIRNPRVWWPYQMGEAALYEMAACFFIDEALSDAESVSFGIRSVKSRINRHGARIFSVNGREILIRGGGWAPDLLMRRTPERNEKDIAYVKNMNLNAIRLEGNAADDDFWNRCDREGILVLSGWTCCSHWERWNYWKERDFDIAVASLRDQLLRLRNHPSFAAWLYGSDRFPPEGLERRYIAVLEEIAPDTSYLSSATAAVSPVSGPTGVKMSGPYAYVPPSYWYDKGLPGSAVGFNSETGPDVSVMAYESLARTLPADQLYRGSEAWNLHYGIGVFGSGALTDRAIELRYGSDKDLRDYCRKAKLLQYECWRAMFEAYGRSFPEGTGVIAWMLNNAWPGQIFHLYDWFLRPGGGFYAAREACRPLHIQYSYDDASIWIVNDTSDVRNDLYAVVRSLDFRSRERYAEEFRFSVSPYERRKIAALRDRDAQDDSATEPRFVDLTLGDASGAIDRNFYWLPAEPDTFSEAHTFYHTAVRSHADMSALSRLPKADLRLEGRIEACEDGYFAEAIVGNFSSCVSLLTELLIERPASGDLVLPVYWDDNMFALLPGETRKVRGRVVGAGLMDGSEKIVYQAFNG